VLSERGVHAVVADARFRKPLDEKLILGLAKDSGHILTVEENVIEGGFGQAVGACLQRHGLLVPVHMLGAPDNFISQGSVQDIRRKLGLDAGGIAKAALDLVGKTRTSRRTA